MRRLAAALTAVLLGGLLYPAAAGGAEGAAIDNVERRVTDHGFRTGADQDQPDVAGDYMVWRDRRGTSDAPYVESATAHGHIWSKNLTTRDEVPVTTDLATDDARPRVSAGPAGTWVVWTDHTPAAGATPANDDIYACLLPCTGSPVQVTDHPAHQMNPAIHGTTVVWEDYRNAGTPFDPSDPDGVDIYMKDLAGGSEAPVIEAQGNQTSPAVSVSDLSKGTATTVIGWRDSRDAVPGFDDSDVWLQITERTRKGAVKATSTIKVTEADGFARSLSAYQVAVSDGQVLWNERDAGCVPDEGNPSSCDPPTVLKTCSFTTAGCVGGIQTVDSGGFQITDLDVSGSQAVWSKQTDAGSHAYTRDLATPTIVQIDDTEQADVFGSRVDGQRFAWAQNRFEVPHTGSDVFWRDASTQPRRANSISLGAFGSHANPAADGDLVVYRRSPIEQGSTGTIESGQVWATNLSGDANPRHFPVTSLFGTDFSRPAIAGERIAWSQCALGFGSDCGIIFERDLGAGPDAQETDLSLLGPPDADGASTGWRCGDTELCLHDGDSLEVFDLSAYLLDSDPGTDPFSVVGRVVRVSDDVSGTLLGWHELWFDPTVECELSPCASARLHVLNVTTGENETVGSGLDSVGTFPDFDISGDEVVWAAGGEFGSEGDTISRNTAVGCGGGGSSCDNSSGAVVFETVAGHALGSVSIGGNRVAWVDCTFVLEGSDIVGCDSPAVYTRTLTESDRHLVTNEAAALVEFPYVDAMGEGDTDDRIYWVDHRHGSADIFMESLDPSDVVAGDETSPAPTANAVATRFGNGVELSWTNPDEDFFRVRILRKSGGDGPSGIDDTTASVVFEGSGTTFTDTDVAPGVTYTYSIFAFDYEPNFSAATTVSTG